MPSKRTYHEKAIEKLYELLDKLERLEKQEMLLMAQQWGVVESELETLIKKLSELEKLSEDQLFRLSLYQEFLAESRNQINKFNGVAAEIIKDGQLSFGKQGLETTQRTIELITVRFNKLPIQAVNNMVGLTYDGTPLNDLLQKSYPETVTKLTNTLLKSTALGKNPLETARLMKADMQGNLTRAITIARTEQMRVLRETSLQQMKISGVVDEWEWLAEKDACDICLEKNGDTFPLTEPFDTHPRCRCAMLPVFQELL